MVAYMLRWRRLVKTKITGALTADEIHSAEKTLFWMVQQEFQVGKPGPGEIKLMRTEDGLWRVVSKITERNDLMTFQYPILLPEKSKLVRMLIRELHERNCHAGVQRFRNEYLSTLAQRVKEKRRERELREGNIVLIGSELNKRLFWPLGRILETYPGRDGVVRVVILRTSDGVFVRPVQKLYPLEMEVSEGDVVYGDAELEESIETQAADEEESQVVQENEAAEVRTRSGRLVRAPSRFCY
ncbi:Uncharacterized protein DBV15_12868 [Temnothorax longispinosus]|uniref:DUF5641 domain-containing protein n=1 Tax=Temnothorax longispinosus TaxID=300112 RepID=A0A4S2L084_9HYME|nr:Uncharacterized protein DBV15_12868 [Temnothorax longispinosus]